MVGVGCNNAGTRWYRTRRPPRRRAHRHRPGLRYLVSPCATVMGPDCPGCPAVLNLYSNGNGAPPRGGRGAPSFMPLAVRARQGRRGRTSAGRGLPCLAAFDHLRSGSLADRDLPRLHRLGKLTLQLDAKQPVPEMRAGDHNMVGQLEATDEASLGNAAVQEL